jgi:hypothetical protein
MLVWVCAEVGAHRQHPKRDKIKGCVARPLELARSQPWSSLSARHRADGSIGSNDIVGAGLMLHVTIESMKVDADRSAVGNVSWVHMTLHSDAVSAFMQP